MLTSTGGDQWISQYEPEERVSFTLTYEHVLRGMVDAGEQGGPPALSIYAGLHTLAVIMACYESARSDGAGQATDVQSLMMPAFREE